LDLETDSDLDHSFQFFEEDLEESKFSGSKTDKDKDVEIQEDVELLFSQIHCKKPNGRLLKRQ